MNCFVIPSLNFVAVMLQFSCGFDLWLILFSLSLVGCCRGVWIKICAGRFCFLERILMHSFIIRVCRSLLRFQVLSLRFGFCCGRMS